MPKERFKAVPASYLILIEHGKILLSRRINTGYEDGNYSFVAGHLDGNETFIQALIREAKEEAGIVVRSEDLKVVHVMHRKTPRDERVDVFIRASKWRNEPKIMEPDRCDDMGWFELDKLPANTVPYIRQAIEMILKEIFYSEHGW